MLKTIVAIAGKPGLFKLVSQGRNMLIVENLATGKRTPAYAHDKVISLGDVAIYTTNEDRPLNQVMQMLYDKNEGKSVDVKALGNDDNVRAYFAEVMPDFDSERVYTADIRKLFAWYNLLVAAGFTEFVKKEGADEV